MILSIDTDKDSPQRLRQAAQFLLSLAGEEPQAEPERMEISEDMLSMFDSGDDSAPERPSDDGFRIQPY